MWPFHSLWISRTEMKPGDRVIWLRSPDRSFLTGWRIERIPGVVVRACLKWLRIRLDLHGVNSFVTVHPDNVLDADADSPNEFR